MFAISDASHSQSQIKVRPVHTARDRRRFIGFPYSLYSSSCYWTGPLRRDQSQLLFSKKHPFFSHGEIASFIAEDSSGQVVGRIAAIVNGAHSKRYDDGVGFFGFFECVEQYEVAALLFDTAAAHLKAKGFNSMRGPTNPSINDCSGLLVKGFDRRPSILMPYNPAYYEDFVLRCGFKRTMGMSAYYRPSEHLNISRLQRGVEVVKKRMPGLRIRHPDMSRFTQEARIMWQIYNQAFESGWGHVPMSEAEFMYMAKSMKPILDPNIVLFLEYNGLPIGFSLSVPNVNPVLRQLQDGRLFPFGFIKLLGATWFGQRREVRTAVMVLLPAYQRRGLDSLLILSTIEQVRQRGYLGSELSWVMDNNLVLKNALTKLGATVDKEYALFEKPLQLFAPRISL